MPEEASGTNPWVTIDRFRDLTSAIVARSALEAAGIPCFLRDENTVRLDWQISNFIGGLRLQVLEEEREAAQDVLRGFRIDDVPDDGAQHAFAEDVCPKCGSAEIHREAKHRGLALAALYFFSLPIARGRREWHCDRCGAFWDDAVR